MSYIGFTEIKDSKIKTKQFYIWNKANPMIILGQILFYPQWRKYVFRSNSVLPIFDESCLREIADFCETQTVEWRGLAK